MKAVFAVTALLIAAGAADAVAQTAAPDPRQQQAAREARDKAPPPLIEYGEKRLGQAADCMTTRTGWSATDCTDGNRGAAGSMDSRWGTASNTTGRANRASDTD